MISGPWINWHTAVISTSDHFTMAHSSPASTRRKLKHLGSEPFLAGATSSAIFWSTSCNPAQSGFIAGVGRRVGLWKLCSSTGGAVERCAMPHKTYHIIPWRPRKSGFGHTAPPCGFCRSFKTVNTFWSWSPLLSGCSAHSRETLTLRANRAINYNWMEEEKTRNPIQGQ